MNGIPRRDKGGMRISMVHSCSQRLQVGLGAERHKREQRCQRQVVEPFRETDLLLGTMRRWLVEATRLRAFERLNSNVIAGPSHFLFRLCPRPLGTYEDSGDGVGSRGGGSHRYMWDTVHVCVGACAQDTWEGQRVTSKPI